ncbi:hypothetical protein [Parabacteroides sp. Marseille-P3160]|uniref:hypothetical protein n=1 Tax=Parabacteroides sp. Marseille-P3160 TaxID=1917887 RepID=UPI00190E721F|nr:hypothetical protein [Parabacteroides sp. Marseille-P3160]
MENQIKDYIAKRYNRWLDYSTYHCTHAGMEDEAIDVLNEVLAMLLEKDPDYILRLYNSRKGQYRELDFFILQMIKLNIQSPTSPYQHKYRPIPTNDNMNFQRIGNDDNDDDDDKPVYPGVDLVDEPDNERDYPAEIAEEMELVRWMFKRLALNDLERCAYVWRFYEDLSFKSWPIPSERKKLYDAFNTVQHAIWQILKSENITKAKPPKGKYDSKRCQIIIKVFNICHKKDLKSKKTEIKYILI